MRALSHPPCQDSRCCRCSGQPPVRSYLRYSNGRNLFFCTFCHLCTGATWFHLIKPLLWVDELTPLAATNFQTVTPALREGPHWRAGQQGCRTFAFVSTPLSPMPLFAADLEKNRSGFQSTLVLREGPCRRVL